jgi:hypothetical protein
MQWGSDGNPGNLIMTIPIVALNKLNKINQESCLVSDIYPVFN